MQHFYKQHEAEISLYWNTNIEKYQDLDNRKILVPWWSGWLNPQCANCCLLSVCPSRLSSPNHTTLLLYWFLVLSIKTRDSSRGCIQKEYAFVWLLLLFYLSNLGYLTEKVKTRGFKNSIPHFERFIFRLFLISISWKHFRGRSFFKSKYPVGVFSMDVNLFSVHLWKCKNFSKTFPSFSSWGLKIFRWKSEGFNISSIYAPTYNYVGIWFDVLRRGETFSRAGQEIRSTSYPKKHWALLVTPSEDPKII